MTPLRNLELPGIPKLRSGKVREVFDLGDTLLFVATDRLSAFDVILPDPIPDKGAVLNQISAFWFRRFDFVESHMITADINHFPSDLAPFVEQLERRSMLVRKTKPLPVECVVRGYLAGSGWKDYQQSGAISGVLGAYILLFPTNRVVVLLGWIAMPMPAFIAIGLWFVFQLISGLGVLGSGSQQGGVAYAAHIGGFIAGLILINIFQIGRPRTSY